MKALTIGIIELRRIGRDRTNIFFLFIFPVVLILLIGAAFGGGATPKVGLLTQDSGNLAEEVATSLRDDPSLQLETYDVRQKMLADVERGALQAGVVVPDGYTESLASGGEATVDYVAKPGDFSAAVRATVDSIVGEQAARLRAARVLEEEAGGGFEQSYEIAASTDAAFSGVEVSYRSAGSDEPRDEGQFDTGASTQLILFTFVNSLAGSVALVQTRNSGMLKRMLGAPISARTILTGETLGRFFVAVMQAVFIIAAAGLIFGVNWGDPLGAAAVVTLFALVSTGAAMLAGSLLSNEQQAGALVPFGLALAALGGSMVPLEVFPNTMRTISRVTPHSWANEAFAKLIGRGEDIGGIATELVALAGFAIVLLALGAYFLRRTLTSS